MPWATSAQSVLDLFLPRPPGANWWAGFILVVFDRLCLGLPSLFGFRTMPAASFFQKMEMSNLQGRGFTSCCMSGVSLYKTTEAA